MILVANSFYSAIIVAWGFIFVNPARRIVHEQFGTGTSMGFQIE